MKWFKHDSDASIDAKLQSLLLDYGASAYGLYWYCLELIAQNVNVRNITFELDHDARVIARNLNLSVKEVNDMMTKMIDLGLFDLSSNNKIVCLKLAYQLDDTMRKSVSTQSILDNFHASRENPESVRKIPSKSGKLTPEQNNNREEENTTTTENSCDGCCDISLLVGQFSDDVKQLVSVLPIEQAQSVLDEISGQLAAGIVIKSVKALARNLVMAVLNGTFTDEYASPVSLKRQRQQANKKRLEATRQSVIHVDRHNPSAPTEKRSIPDVHRSAIEAMIGSKIKKG
jgi:hypothetical protein